MIEVLRCPYSAAGKRGFELLVDALSCQRPALCESRCSTYPGTSLEPLHVLVNAWQCRGSRGVAWSSSLDACPHGLSTRFGTCTIQDAFQGSCMRQNPDRTIINDDATTTRVVGTACKLHANQRAQECMLMHTGARKHAWAHPSCERVCALTTVVPDDIFA